MTSTASPVAPPPRSAPRPRRARLAAVAVGAALLATAGGVQPAAAATPPQVGLVSFIAASLSGTTTAKLTVTWPAVAGADSYEVRASKSSSMSSPIIRTSKTNTLRISTLARKTNYFVQVRAKDGSTFGPWSSRSGHRTISAQGTAKGVTYQLMTYNLCSMYCENWSTRAPHVASRISELKPDAVALQESSRFHNSFGDGRITIPGYAEVVYRSSKSILINRSRFVTARTEKNTRRTGDILLRKPSNGDANKYAVWADLVDRRNGKHVIVVSAHLTPGKTDTPAKYRKGETKVLLEALKVINPQGYPVVMGGDFNSHKNRDNDTVSPVMRSYQYDDAFDEAMVLARQHQNSYGGFDTKPRIGVTWGDHVDHWWVKPTLGRVLNWQNAGKMANGQYTTPVPSDHRPIMVRIQIN